MATQYIIDVSGWQPDNICSLVNYDGAIIKATEGLDYTSPNLTKQSKGVTDRGKLFGLYHFAEQGQAVKEAAYFVDTIKPYLGKAALWLDYEANATGNGREWARAFVREVKRLTGIPCGIYASSSVIKMQNLTGICKDEGVKLWCANYPLGYQTMGWRTDLTPDVKCDMHQYTSSGYLAGYSGPLDLSVWFGSAADFKALYGKPAATPAPANPDTGIRYRAHVQKTGWQGWKKDGETAGTTGKALRMEGLNIDLTGLKGGKLRIKGCAYFGGAFTVYKEINPDTLIGSTGKGLALEDVGFQLLENTTGKKLQYRVHAASYGWSKWQTVTSDMLHRGSTDQSRRLEAIQFRLV